MIARAKIQESLLPGIVPDLDDPIATVTFILFESLIQTVLKKTSLSSPALFFLPLGRPFGFPDWPILKRDFVSLRSSSAICLLQAEVRGGLNG
jgi:hypothetical protein